MESWTESELVKDYMNYNFLSFAKNIQGALKKKQHFFLFLKKKQHCRSFCYYFVYLKNTKKTLLLRFVLNFMFKAHDGTIKKNYTIRVS